MKMQKLWLYLKGVSLLCALVAIAFSSFRMVLKPIQAQKSPFMCPTSMFGDLTIGTAMHILIV